MVTQRRHLRLLPCRECGHLRASHYLLAPQEGRVRRHFARPRDRTTPMPCHVLTCNCARFGADSQVFLCPVCSREYATRASLEIHLYGQHPGLSSRERSVLLQGAMSGQTVLPPSVVARLPSRPSTEEEIAEA
ncbi:MAG: hypothetical protein L3K00_05335 [Thermoplasmata archaeon]|nr:hypothetical protein [Thermoplasmata archaeon]MCI4361804.1 hypothetical protein [Thermoplasmata archaeon]